MDPLLTLYLFTVIASAVTQWRAVTRFRNLLLPFNWRDWLIATGLCLIPLANVVVAAIIYHDLHLWVKEAQRKG